MRSTIAVTAALTLLATLAVAGPAAAGDRTCTSTISGASIDGNVIVPDGASCTLDDTTVDGNVLVGRSARLTVTDATIEGNIQDDNGDAGAVTVTASEVDDIQLEQGTSLSVRGSTLNGNLQFEANRGALLADDNTIDGDLQANQNTGGVTIVDNVIDGNLQCQGNDPAPTGGGNRVSGSAEDQCAQLTGSPAPAPTPDPTTGFVDVPADLVHADAIRWLVEANVTQGCAPQRFCPGVSVTRAQMATFLDRALDLPAGSAAFSDVPATSVHAAGIGAVAEAGITTGCATGRFCPDEPVTRAQMATFLDRALDLPAGDATFDDVPPTSTHVDGIGAVLQAGITQGCTSDGRSFCPTQPVTRAQMATFLFNARS